MLIGQTTVLPNGTWSLRPDNPLAEGPHSITIKQTDAAGNQSPAASLTAPDTTPDILSVVDDQPGVTGPISQNGITNDRTPTLNGTAEPGSTITIHSGGDVLGTVVVPSSGQWTFTPSTPLAEGAHVLTATSSNGNV